MYNDSENEEVIHDMPFVVPEEETLLELLEFEKEGDILGLKKWIERIQLLDEAYTPFLTKIKPFVERYEIEKIVDFINPYIKEKS